MKWLTVELILFFLVTAENIVGGQIVLPEDQAQQVNAVQGPATDTYNQSSGQSSQNATGQQSYGHLGQATQQVQVQPGQSGIGQSTPQTSQQNATGQQSLNGQLGQQAWGQTTQQVPVPPGQSGTGQSTPQTSQNVSKLEQNVTTTSSQQEDVDTDESLADFIYHKIAGSDNNTQPSPGSGSNPASAPAAVPTVVQDTAPKLTPVPSIKSSKDCSLDLPLDNFCEVPQVVRTYFEGVVTLATVVEKLYEPAFLTALEGYECGDGEWCLPDQYREIIKSDASEFYSSSPFCTSGMIHCVASIIQQQSACAGLAQYRMLTFLNETLELLCDARFSSGLDANCFASTLEILYITFEDVQRGNDVLAQHQDDLQRNDCNPYLVEMTKMYLCADEDCENFASKEILSRFPEWQGMPDRAVDIKKSCNITVVCESENYDSSPEQYDDMSEDEYLEEVEEILKEELNEVEEEEEQYEDNEGMTGDAQEAAGEENTYDANDSPGFLYGMLALATVVLVVFLAVAIISYKRILRRDRYMDFSRYNKLDTDEETRMLAHVLN